MKLLVHVEVCCCNYEEIYVCSNMQLNILHLYSCMCQGHIADRTCHLQLIFTAFLLLNKNRNN